MRNIFSEKKVRDAEVFTAKIDKNGEAVFHGDTAASVPVEVNVNELEAELKANISGEVRFDNGSRALYATDASNYRQVPVGVIIPRNKEDVIKSVSVCHKYQV